MIVSPVIGIVLVQRHGRQQKTIQAIILFMARFMEESQVEEGKTVLQFLPLLLLNSENVVSLITTRTAMTAMFIGTIPAEREKIKPTSAAPAVGQAITNVPIHIYKENILTKDALMPPALLLLNGKLTRTAELTPGQAITNVQELKSKSKSINRDVLTIPVMITSNGKILMIVLFRARPAVMGSV